MRFSHDSAGCVTPICHLDYHRNQIRPPRGSLVTCECGLLCPMGSLLKRFVLCLVIVAVVVLLARHAGRFLVVDEPAKADAIVVLAGETNARPARALELLHHGLAPRVFLDAEERSLIYDELLVDIARRYVNSRGESDHVSICTIVGYSTFAEVDDVNRCLQSLGAHRILLVTSEFHTRRTAMIFRHRLPQYEIYVAAAHNPWQFGERWWTNREWAKTTFDEWLKIFWWQAVDRWR
jgi:uncharacterized SAM-binding protein YcdF (DUF218 family)